MSKSKIFIVISLFASISCNNNDTYKELVGSYIYRDEGGDIKQILKNNESFKKEIYGKVLSYDYNQKFIIVSQQPSSEDYIAMLSFYLREDTIKYPNNDKNSLKKSEKEADSVIENDKFYQSIFKNDTNYWIIQIVNDSLIGPLAKSEFEITRKELGVPDNLRLD